MGLNPIRVLALDLANRPAEARLEQKSIARWSINYAVRCEDPIVIPKDARPMVRVGDSLMVHGISHPIIDRREDGRRAVFLDMEVPCRKCGACLRARAAHWRKRALIELARAPRTWFATYTLSDQALWECTLGARVLATRANLAFDQLEPDDKFRLQVRALGPELTRHWKRLRKNSKAPLRFMWVAENASKGEREDTGNPHIHALIHERFIDKPIRKAVLRGSWRLGFDKYNLVEDGRHAWYISKYIGKQIRCPVRASSNYGKELLLPSPLERAVPLGASANSDEVGGGVGRRPNEISFGTTSETEAEGARATKAYSLEETFK